MSIRYLDFRGSMAHNKLVFDAKTEAVELRFRHIDLAHIVSLAIGESSFANGQDLKDTALDGWSAVRYRSQESYQCAMGMVHRL